MVTFDRQTVVSYHKITTAIKGLVLVNIKFTNSLLQNAYNLIESFSCTLLKKDFIAKFWIMIFNADFGDKT